MDVQASKPTLKFSPTPYFTSLSQTHGMLHVKPVSKYQIDVPVSILSQIPIPTTLRFAAKHKFLKFISN